ncbi:MAG: hypothetical protein IJY01_00425 [Clostridia bacterium]|nr:hypothetical protein [Clostridia bacterium]
MINFTEIAQMLEDRLNGNLNEGDDYEYIKQYHLDGISNPDEAIVPNERYEFKIHTDTGIYERAERVNNTVRRYINGVMSIVGNTVEGISNSTYSAVVQTRVDFVIPFAEGTTEQDRNRILMAVRELMSDALKYSDGETIDGIDGLTYLYIINYSLANSGTRSQINDAGDSFTLSLNINHSFVTLGVASSEYRFYILEDNDATREVDIPYQKYGMARKTTFDTNTDESLTSVNVPTSTVLTINFDLYKRVDAFDNAINDYLFDGALNPITIYILNTRTNAKKEYDMYIDTAALNGQVGAVASSSVTLVSALSI